MLPLSFSSKAASAALLVYDRQDAGFGTNPSCNVAALSNGGNSVAGHSHSFRQGQSCIHRDDATATQDQVGWIRSADGNG